MKKGTLCILAATLLWGMVPYFSKSLMNTGTSPVAVAAVRCYVGAAFFILYDLIRGKIPKISLHSIPVFLVMGMAGIAGSFIFYAIAIQKLSTSMAVMLLITATGFVIIFNRIAYKEPITTSKVLVIIMIIGGCFLVVRGYDPAAMHADLAGIMLGLLSGICYAAFTILSKKTLKYTSADISITYAFIFAALTMAFMHPDYIPAGMSSVPWLSYILMGTISTAIPYGLYVKGMSYGVGSAYASVIASAEPVTAAVMGVILLHESLAWAQIAGIVIMLSSICLPAIEKHRRDKVPQHTLETDKRAAR
jgi:Predicted permease, DMT superfamily